MQVYPVLTFMYDLSCCFQLSFLFLKKINKIKVTYTAAESEPAEFSRVSSRPCIAVLLWQQQDEGHRQRQMVEAVDVGVVPLLQWREYNTSYLG